MFCWSRPPMFRIAHASRAGQPVLSLRGDATSDMAPLWQNEFLRLVGERRPLLVLDLSQLKSTSNLFMTSLERLVDCQQRHGGQVKLLRPRPVIREMLDLRDLGHLVDRDGSPPDDHSGIMRSVS